MTALGSAAAEAATSPGARRSGEAGTRGAGDGQPLPGRNGEVTLRTDLILTGTSGGVTVFQRFETTSERTGDNVQHRWLKVRLTYANVTATVALFLALGGVAAAGTLIDGSSIIVRSLPANRLMLHSLRANEIRIPPEQLIGAPAEPAFGAGWKNAGSGAQVAGFYRDVLGVVHLRGAVALGGSTTTIFTLPVGYRPAATEEFSAVLDTGGSALILVTAAGDVNLLFINSPSTPHTLSLSQTSFRAGA